jgi:hypothetical protein
VRGGDPLDHAERSDRVTDAVPTDPRATRAPDRRDGGGRGALAGAGSAGAGSSVAGGAAGAGGGGSVAAAATGTSAAEWNDRSAPTASGAQMAATAQRRVNRYRRE